MYGIVCTFTAVYHAFRMGGTAPVTIGESGNTGRNMSDIDTVRFLPADDLDSADNPDHLEAPVLRR